MSVVNIKTKNKFGKWLKRYLNKRKIDVTTLAKKMGIGRRHITHWIQGTSHPRLVNAVFLIIALSKLTGDTPEDIFRELLEEIVKDY
tara:strand:+ start:223 stop:483 length:261 start_codon:yes stop_codon:yes gene_type:complete